MLVGELEPAEQVLESSQARQHVKLKWDIERTRIVGMLAEDMETEREVVCGGVELRDTTERDATVVEQVKQRALVAPCALRPVDQIQRCAVVLKGAASVAPIEGASREIRRQYLAAP